VFPVLSLKVLGLLQKPGKGDALAYCAGVVVSFELLAAGLLAARAAGASLGWGFHLQSAPVVAALALLCVLLGLNLLGFFEVGTRLMGAGSGSRGAFASGVFAVIVAAPCTAPFMGAALGWALTRPAWETLAVFGALGLGTAAPYAVLASWPALLKRLPRPGAWMETLKKALSVPMFATALWLAWVFIRLMSPAVADKDWKVWSPEAVSLSRAAGKTVFVDFTAAWCLSCQVNERVVLSRPEVKAALARGHAYKADWTNRDAVIAAELSRHGRSGVPLYIVYPKGGEAVTLPEILTPQLVLDALGEP
jgi:thiol:disulfide interchange protein DsbD